MVNKSLSDHPSNGASLNKHGINDDTHEPNGRTSVDETYLLSSKLSSQLDRVVSIRRLSARTGTGIDADAPYGHFAVDPTAALR